MASRSAGSRPSKLVLHRDPSPIPALHTLNKNITKLNDLWTKFKSPPLSIAFLVKDLVLLSNLIANGLNESRYRSGIPPIIQAALRLCAGRSSELLDLTNKYTGRLSRKVLSGDKLHALESLLGDSKVKFLFTQLLVERYVLYHLT